jgi:glycosyltransferase involved in cell wall biosynthesis
VPSICFEVFAQVIIEAFGLQTPAIVSNMGGMPEIMGESGGGLVYNTEEELITAMSRLLADPLYRRELGLRGYEAYQRKWTPEAHLRGYLSLIREISSTKRMTRIQSS